MLAWKVIEVKAFMSDLFIHETFDSFLLSEAEFITSNEFHIFGKLQKEWFSLEEWETLAGREYSYWGEIKPLLFQIIKGKKTPQSMKIVLVLSKKQVKELLEQSQVPIHAEEIGGVFLNIRYNKAEAVLTTGIAFQTFIMDKSLEQEWDRKLELFFKEHNILIEKL